MANRRMFSKDVTLQDTFLDMGATARLLYYDLGMAADDEGFISPKFVMRMTGASEDDLKVLIAKGFVIPFDSGVIVIRHWRENNYLQSDRLKPTQFVKEKSKLLVGDNNVYRLDTECIQNVSIGEGRVGEGRVGEGRVGEGISRADSAGEQINTVIKLFGNLNPSYEVLFKRKGQRESTERLLNKYGLDKVKQMVESLVSISSDKFAPTVTTPSQLEDKMGLLISYFQKQKPKIASFKKGEI